MPDAQVRREKRDDRGRMPVRHSLGALDSGQASKTEDSQSLLLLAENEEVVAQFWSAARRVAEFSLVKIRANTCLDHQRRSFDMDAEAEALQVSSED